MVEGPSDTALRPPPATGRFSPVLFPREHGAWAALVESILLGFLLLGRWETWAAAGVTAVLAAFLVRVPLRGMVQYASVDPRTARAMFGKALGEGALFAVSAALFWALAPASVRAVALAAAAPLGFCLGLRCFLGGTLRTPFWEVVGMAAATLPLPLLLAGTEGKVVQACLAWGLFGGYFILSVPYVGLRRRMFLAFRRGEDVGWKRRLREGRGVFLLHLLFAVAFAVGGAGFSRWLPLLPLLRAIAGVLFGDPALPLRRLGVRETLLSMLYSGLFLCAGSPFRPPGGAS